MLGSGSISSQAPRYMHRSVELLSGLCLPCFLGDYIGASGSSNMGQLKQSCDALPDYSFDCMQQQICLFQTIVPICQECALAARLYPSVNFVGFTRAITGSVSLVQIFRPDILP